jgi:hypothetical protein
MSSFAAVCGGERPSWLFADADADEAADEPVFADNPLVRTVWYKLDGAPFIVCAVPLAPFATLPAPKERAEESKLVVDSESKRLVDQLEKSPSLLVSSERRGGRTEKRLLRRFALTPVGADGLGVMVSIE